MKLQLDIAKTCPSCERETTDFSANVPVCRPCKRKRNARTNPRYNKYNLSMKQDSYRRKFPSLPDCGVYGLFNTEGKLMYIGESHTMPYRVYCHLGKWANAPSKFAGIDTSGWYPKVLWKGTNELQRKMKEKHLIQTLNPKHNIIYNGGR